MPDPRETLDRLDSFQQPGNVSLPVDQRQSLVRSTQRFAGQLYRCTFIHQMAGAGELTVEVAFPLQYVEEPDPWHGARVAPNSPIKDGNMPTHSMTVMEWVVQGGLYLGARIVYVTTGEAKQVLLMKSYFEGNALVNPVHPPVITGGVQ